MPNKKHIIAFLLILLSAVLFISGFYRACRISSRLSMEGLVFEPEVYEGDSILLSANPLKARMKETERERVVNWCTISKGIITDYDCFVVQVAEKYRPVMVRTGTEEYNKFLDGEEVSGYFTEKNFEDFPSFILNMGKYYELKKEITDKDYSTLGIVIVNRQKELLSFLWGIPFLAISLVLFKKAGSVFFYIPETDETEE